MKKQICAATMLASTLISGAACAATSFQDAGGSVEFTGEIIESSCNVISTAKNQKIPLGNWAKTYFTATGDETTKQPFSIKVENCPTSVTSVAVLFDGKKDTTDATLLALNPGSAAAPAATGVAIKLYNANGAATQIPLGQVSDAVTPHNAEAELKFLADYEATSTTVTSGSANGTVNFLMVYN